MTPDKNAMLLACLNAFGIGAIALLVYRFLQELLEMAR